jgi:hypothetical protein
MPTQPANETIGCAGVLYYHLSEREISVMSKNLLIGNIGGNRKSRAGNGLIWSGRGANKAAFA